MGVLPCSRIGCENILCNRYSPKYGYICDECFEELVNCGVTTDISEFLLSTKGEYKNKIKDSFKFFENIFTWI